MTKTVDDLFSVITSDDGLMEFLWVVSLGEPISSDGEIYETGDTELAEFTYNLLFCPNDGIVRLEDIVTDPASSVRDQASSLSKHDVADLSDEDWIHLRDLLLEHGKGRGILCRYCDHILWSDREDFENHYREDKCWED